MRRTLGSLLIGGFLLAGCGPHITKPSFASIAYPSIPLKEQARRLGLRYPLRRVFLRAFKSEKKLELWASNGPEPMKRVRSYSIAAASGAPGPKRQAGDLQVPEGFYRIDRFNPHSRFHLSLGINYPNQSDRFRSDRARPGTDIFIHGNRVSIGCLAMTDRVIDELYPVCFSAENCKGIPVHIFPCRMDGESMETLDRSFPMQASFWSELMPVYEAFEKTHQVPQVTISPRGAYRLKA